MDCGTSRGHPFNKRARGCMSPCAICGTAIAPRRANSFYPFCSARCRLIDLGNWLGEKYRIADPPAKDAPVPTRLQDGEDHDRDGRQAPPFWAGKDTARLAERAVSDDAATGKVSRTRPGPGQGESNASGDTNSAARHSAQEPSRTDGASRPVGISGPSGRRGCQ